VQENKKMLKMKVAPNNLLKTKGYETTKCHIANDSMKTNDLSENANEFMKTNQIS
jgi:tRNA G26 N,N-dimethylase Trm1